MGDQRPAQVHRRKLSEQLFLPPFHFIPSRFTLKPLSRNQDHNLFWAPDIGFSFSFFNLGLVALWCVKYEKEILLPSVPSVEESKCPSDFDLLCPIL